MTEAEFKKHLDAAEKSPEEIAAAVSGLSERILRYKPSPERWCVLEILGHLADIVEFSGESSPLQQERP